MNALAVSDKLAQLGVPSEVLTSIDMPKVAPVFDRKAALEAMEGGQGGHLRRRHRQPLLLHRHRPPPCGCGSLGRRDVQGHHGGRRLRQGPAQVPPDAKKYDTLTFTKVLEDQLAVMDGTAATLCRDNRCPFWCLTWPTPTTCTGSPGRKCGHFGLRGVTRRYTKLEQPAFRAGPGRCMLGSGLGAQPGRIR